MSISNRNRLRLLLVIFGLIILMHNSEEALTMVQEIQENCQISSYSLRSSVLSPGFNSLVYGSLILATLIPVLIFIYIHKHLVKRKIQILALVTLLFLINAVQHTIVSVVMLKYTPGLFTALFLVIPYSFYLLKTLSRTYGQGLQLISGKMILLSVILYLPSIFMIWGMSWAIQKLVLIGMS